MPVSPTPDDSYYFEIAQAYQQAELDILGQIRDRLARGVTLSDQDWATSRLAEVQVMRRDATAELAKVNRTMASRINGSFGSAYKDGEIAALKDAAEYLPGKPSAVSSDARKRSVAAIARENTARTAEAMGGILRQAEDDYRATVADVVRRTSAGSIDRRTATDRALKASFGKGLMTGPANSRGVRMSLPDYVTMATRTGVAKSMIEGHLDSLGANGVELVYIQPGPRHCERCDIWANVALHRTNGPRGTIFVDSMVDDRQLAVYVQGSLNDARAEGWGHPNCRCSVGGYFPGATEKDLPKPRPKWDEKGYEAQQGQRRLERQIRDAKLRGALSTDPDERARADREVRLNQAALRAHLERNPELKRQPRREALPTTSGGSTPPRTPRPAPKPPETPRKPAPVLSDAQKARNAATMYGEGSPQHREMVRKATDGWDERTAKKSDDFVPHYSKAAGEAGKRAQFLRADQVPEDRWYDEDPEYYAWNMRRMHIRDLANDMASAERAAKRAATKAAKDAKIGSAGAAFVKKFGPDPGFKLPMSSARVKANPNGRGWGPSGIGSAAKDRSYEINCSRVALAVELRARGYDVSATGLIRNDNQITNIEANWVQVDGKVRKFSMQSSFEQMERAALQEGEGARFMVFGSWKAGGAHIWNAEIKNGKLVYVEAQSDSISSRNPTNLYNNMLKWQLVEGRPALGGGVGIMRVDDLLPTDNIARRGWVEPTKR